MLLTKAGRTTGLRATPLRETIAAYISRTREIQAGPQHVCVVPGGKPIIFFPLLALLEPGDEVIYPNPGFPIYESMIRFLGAKPVPVPLIENRGFSFDLNVLRDSLRERTKLLILNSPQNPTGGIIPATDIRTEPSVLSPSVTISRDHRVPVHHIANRLCPPEVTRQELRYDTLRLVSSLPSPGWTSLRKTRRQSSCCSGVKLP